jgi:hypothetical protein
MLAALGGAAQEAMDLWSYQAEDGMPANQVPDVFDGRFRMP